MVVLLTDFGLYDPYVGQMKGVLYQNHPQARIVDLGHEVIQYNIAQAGFILAASLQYFPSGSVFVAVVDPGVGSERGIVLASTRRAWILAPDNGLLDEILQSGLIDKCYSFCGQWPASNTFHGRDIFAPLAAEIARENRVPEVFKPLDPGQLIRPDPVRPKLSGSSLVCRVVHQDRYGNLILDLEIENWQGRLQESKLELAGYDLIPASCYAEIPDGCLGLVPGSQGKLEVAAREKSARLLTGLGAGEKVVMSVNPFSSVGNNYQKTSICRG